MFESSHAIYYFAQNMTYFPVPSIRFMVSSHDSQRDSPRNPFKSIDIPYLQSTDLYDLALLGCLFVLVPSLG